MQYARPDKAEGNKTKQDKASINITITITIINHGQPHHLTTEKRQESDVHTQVNPA
jgi:hypothetical protein